MSDISKIPMSRVDNLIEALSDITVESEPFVGATTTTDGKIGLVPAPTMADVDHILQGDGTWAVNYDEDNVKKFGAKGDGVTDDTAAIQNAINSSSRVVFDGGTYLVSSEIYITKGCIIDGRGCTIKSTNSANTGVFTVTASGVTIQNINFLNNEKPESTNRTGSYCISLLSGSDSIRIDSCNFDNFRVCIYSSTNNVDWVTNITITNCVFNAYDQGCLLDDFKHVIISNCKGFGVEITQYNTSLETYDPPHFLYVTDRSGSAKSDLTMIGCLEVGNIYSSSFKVRYCHGVTLVGNTSSGCCRGFEIDLCEDVLIDGNIVRNMCVTDTTVNPNTDNYQSSIWLASVQNAHVSNNLTVIPNSLPIWHFRITLDSNFTTVLNKNITITNNTCVYKGYASRANIIAYGMEDSLIENNRYVNTGVLDNGLLLDMHTSTNTIFQNNSYRGPADSGGKYYAKFTDCTGCKSVYNVTDVDGSSVNSITNGTDAILSNQTIQQRGFASQVDVPTAWNTSVGFKRVSTGLGFFCEESTNTPAEVFTAKPITGGIMLEFGTDLLPKTTNTLNIGSASYKWKEIFASTGTINTSDKREKQHIQEIDDRVFKAWEKVSFKQFLFKNAVSEKGENARIHFGLIAQQVKKAFEDEGLDGFKYGLLCYDEWDDIYADTKIIDKEATYDKETGKLLTPEVSHYEKTIIKPAGNAYGIRYTEALALECAYQRWKLNKILKRLESIEKESGD